MRNRTRWLSLLGMIGCFWAATARAQVPDWAFGPFVRPTKVNPVITPDPHSVFYCPMRRAPVHWEARATFNPAAVVKGGQVWLLYRAEDDSGGPGIGRHTSRLGLAISNDGLHFQRFPAPVFYPADDAQKANEWDGGCEDPRLVETGAHDFVLLYTQWNRQIARLAVATSKNLLQWTKHGPAFATHKGWSKSGSIVCRLSGGRLTAAKIHGKYWMYWGDNVVRCAWSRDLIHWAPGRVVLRPRKGRFDSDLVEAGPPAVLTSGGIVLLYNGKNSAQDGDTALPANTYAAGEARFDARQPTRLLDRMAHPFFKPEEPFERTGQYRSGTTFVEGLVCFHRKWFLYYGGADSVVGVAVWTPSPAQQNRFGFEAGPAR